MKMKWIGRYDSGIKLWRLFRVVGDGTDFSWKFTVGFRLNKLFGFVRGWHECIVTVFGIRVHWRKSFGGRFAL